MRRPSEESYDRPTSFLTVVNRETSVGFHVGKSRPHFKIEALSPTDYDHGVVTPDIRDAFGRTVPDIAVGRFIVIENMRRVKFINKRVNRRIM